MKTRGILLAVPLIVGCQDSGTHLATDTSTDTAADAATVPTCEVVAGWSIGVTQTSASAGTVSARVDLDSPGATPTCAGPPCLVVTALAGGGTVEDLVQESPTRATFRYVNDSIDAGGEAQVLLRWRALCTDAGSEEERTVAASPWICADGSRTLSIGLSRCP